MYTRAAILSQSIEYCNAMYDTKGNQIIQRLQQYPLNNRFMILHRAPKINRHSIILIFGVFGPLKNRQKFAIENCSHFWDPDLDFSKNGPRIEKGRFTPAGPGLGQGAGLARGRF